MTNLKCDFDIKGAKVLAFPPNDIPTSLRNKLNKGDVFIKFNSLDDLSEAMTEYTNVKTYRESSMKKESWSGSKDWNEYLKFLKEGDPKIINKIKELTQKRAKELKDKYQYKIDKYKLDVSGDMFDVGMVLENIPECWIKKENNTEDKPCIDINVNVVASGSVDVNILIEGGARVIALAHFLEQNDIMVKINIMMSNDEMDSRDDSRIFCYSCLLKGYNEPIDYNKASALISPTFLRRGGFKLLEMVYKDKLEWGYGCPIRDLDGMLYLAYHDTIDKFEEEVINNL